jgi:hypothetical protein
LASCQGCKKKEEEEEEEEEKKGKEYWVFHARPVNDF